MPAQKRFKTRYPGVYYIKGRAVGSTKTEKIYYITYRKGVKQIHEKAGRQFQDDMTPARAARIRFERIKGAQLSNKERRERVKVEAKAKADRMTIERLWIEYKENKPNLKGLVTDENRFQNYIKPKFGHLEPFEIYPIDIDRLRINLLKKKSRGTVKNVLELLRRIINFGVNKNLSKGLGFTIEMPKATNAKTEDLAPEQLLGLLKAIEEDSNIQAANMMKMALYTGMRRGEMFKLKWGDIDLDRGFIHLRDPKGGLDQKIPINNTTKQLIKNHPRSKSEYVFPGRGGRMRKDIKHQVNRIKERAGLPKDFRALHGLRHAYASMLASSGQVDMYTLQKLLTHKSPVMTQRYAHLRDQALKRAAGVTDDLFGEILNGDKAEGKVVNLKGKK